MSHLALTGHAQGDGRSLQPHSPVMMGQGCDLSTASVPPASRCLTVVTGLEGDAIQKALLGKLCKRPSGPWVQGTGPSLQGSLGRGTPWAQRPTDSRWFCSACGATGEAVGQPQGCRDSGRQRSSGINPAWFTAVYGPLESGWFPGPNADSDCVWGLG